MYTTGQGRRGQPNPLPTSCVKARQNHVYASNCSTQADPTEEEQMSKRLPRAITILAAVAGIAFSTATAGPAEAEGYYNPEGVYERLHCVTEYGACQAALDAKDWAFAVTAWLYPGYAAHNDVADAFRHCTWAGAMGQRLGYQKAAEISGNHELAAGQPEGEYLMDVSNNAIGLVLAGQSAYYGGDDTWGWIMNQCQYLADMGQLYGPGGHLGNY